MTKSWQTPANKIEDDSWYNRRSIERTHANNTNNPNKIL